MSKNNSIENKSTKIKAIVIIGLIIISALIFIIVYNMNKDTDKHFEDINVYSEFFLAQNMLSLYYSYKDNTAKYALLDKDYINNNNITTNTELEPQVSGDETLSFKAQHVKSLKGKKYNIYMVEGYLLKNTYYGIEVIDDNSHSAIFVDETNNTFSIYPDIDDENMFLTIDNVIIEPNNYNKVLNSPIYKNFDVCLLYYNDFTFKVQYLTSQAIDRIDKSSEVKLGSEELLNKYNAFTSIKNCSEGINNTNTYIIENNLGEKIIIKTYGLIDYSVYFE